ncbi:MAG TPA: hypothetical protein VNL98_02220 [Gemmatimonadales bacterium]|nr:hypothetical protein [Gemmatimonadales bacterium]
MHRLTAAVAVGTALIVGRDATAQSPNAPATYGEVQLSGGFMPDPHTRSLTAGGSVSPSIQGCSYGRVANAPDYKLHYSAGGGRTLYFYATSGSDVTLLINMPDGSWRCDDDGLGGNNPLVVIPNAPSGRYDIWVGTYGQSTAPAQLMISEIDPRGGGGGGGGGAIDINANPNYGTVNLSGGFMPDPHTTSLTAGGSLRVNVGGCTYGYVSGAPDVRLVYSGNNSRTLYIYATAGSDITLLVNMPDGSWRCDDDSYGNGNPLLVLPNAPSGRYEIWVGTYGTSTTPAQLMISEIRPR